MKPEEKAKVFFEERFGKSKSKTDGYFTEWVERFETGYPENFMGEWERMIYKRLIKQGKIIINLEEDWKGDYKWIKFFAVIH